MVYTFLIITTSLLALLGLTELIHGIRVFAVSNKRRAPTFSVVHLNNISPVQQLKYALEQFIWMGSEYADRIIAVTDDLDEKNKELCKHIRGADLVTFCSLDKLSEVLEKHRPDSV